MSEEHRQNKHSKLKSLIKGLTDRIKKLQLCTAEHGYCQDQFKQFMVEIMSKVFSKGQTKIILHSDDIVKSMLNYCSKKSQSHERLIFELLTEIQQKISHLSEPQDKNRNIENPISQMNSQTSPKRMPTQEQNIPKCTLPQQPDQSRGGHQGNHDQRSLKRRQIRDLIRHEYLFCKTFMKF